jgi:hypothetical protein
MPCECDAVAALVLNSRSTRARAWWLSRRPCDTPADACRFGDAVVVAATVFRSTHAVTNEALTRVLPRYIIRLEPRVAR